jgi:mono/diheme cytochrome c family protein
MPSLPNKINRLVCLFALAGVAIAASGCGTEAPDKVRGRQLFLSNCATCHTLAQAGQGAQVGPNLDDAFRAARASGQDSDTIRGIVRDQIAYPRPITGNPAVSMPADLVKGQDAEDVAAYVAEYAGVPGAAPPKVPGGPGAQVFANNLCGSCHTLSEAKSGGVTGPNLDEVLPGTSSTFIKTSITNPNAEIAKGYAPNVMPQNYGTTIPASQLDQLVQYLMTSTGDTGGGSGSGGGGAKGSAAASQGGKGGSGSSGKSKGGSGAKSGSGSGGKGGGNG